MGYIKMAKDRKHFDESLAGSVARLNGEIQDVSAMVISDKAAQLRVNNQVDAEISRLVKFSDKTFSQNKAARGVIKKIMDENKAAAAEEVANLAKEATASIKATR